MPPESGAPVRARMLMRIKISGGGVIVDESECKELETAGKAVRCRASTCIKSAIC